MNWAAPLSLVLIVAWIAGCAQAPQEQKIGAILPLTGPASYIGEEARNAILLADPEGQVAIDDSKGDAKQAVLAASRMMDKNISYLIAWMSGPSGAVAPLAQERHAVLIYGSTVNNLASENTYVFKHHMNIEQDCRRLAQQLKGRRGALLGGQTESTLLCAEAFKDEGVKLHMELYEKGQADFRTQLTKIKEEKPEFLVLRAMPNENPIIFRQMAEAGISATIICPTISSQQCNGGEITAKYAGLLRGAIGTDYYPDESNRQTQEFLRAYKQRFGREPSSDAIYAYEDVVMLKAAMTQCKGVQQAADCVRDVLAAGDAGIQVRFSDSRISQTPARIWQFNGTAWTPMK